MLHPDQPIIAVYIIKV